MLLLQHTFHFTVLVTYSVSYYTYIHVFWVVNSKLDTAVLASILQIMRNEMAAQWQAIYIFFYNNMGQFLHTVITVALYLQNKTLKIYKSYYKIHFCTTEVNFTSLCFIPFSMGINFYAE